MQKKDCKLVSMRHEAWENEADLAQTWFFWMCANNIQGVLAQKSAIWCNFILECLLN